MLSAWKSTARFSAPTKQQFLASRCPVLFRTTVSDLTAQRFNAQIPWFIQKYQQEETTVREEPPRTGRATTANSAAEAQAPTVETLTPTVDSLTPTVESVSSQITETFIRYSDRVIVHSDPVEDIEDEEINRKVLQKTEETLGKLQTTLNYKDVSIIHSKIKTSKDFLILLNSMDSKQHNDRILITLKQFLKKYKHPVFSISNINMVGYRQDYLSKKQRQRKERRLSSNKAEINTRFHKRHGSDAGLKQFSQGNDMSWGMLSFVLAKDESTRFLFELHVMSPLQRTLLNFEELYDLEGHGTAAELLENSSAPAVKSPDSSAEDSIFEESIFEGVQRR